MMIPRPANTPTARDPAPGERQASARRAKRDWASRSAICAVKYLCTCVHVCVGVCTCVGVWCCAYVGVLVLRSRCASLQVLLFDHFVVGRAGGSSTCFCSLELCGELAHVSLHLHHGPEELVRCVSVLLRTLAHHSKVCQKLLLRIPPRLSRHAGDVGCCCGGEGRGWGGWNVE